MNPCRTAQGLGLVIQKTKHEKNRKIPCVDPLPCFYSKFFLLFDGPNLRYLYDNNLLPENSPVPPIIRRGRVRRITTRKALSGGRECDSGARNESHDQHLGYDDQIAAGATMQLICPRSFERRAAVPILRPFLFIFSRRLPAPPAGIMPSLFPPIPLPDFFPPQLPLFFLLPLFVLDCLFCIGSRHVFSWRKGRTGSLDLAMI